MRHAKVQTSTENLKIGKNFFNKPKNSFFLVKSYTPDGVTQTF